jgi:hypothetical protein
VCKGSENSWKGSYSFHRARRILVQAVAEAQGKGGLAVEGLYDSEGVYSWGGTCMWGYESLWEVGISGSWERIFPLKLCDLLVDLA